MQVSVWISRDLDLKTTKQVSAGMTVAQLKELLAADDPLGETSAADLVLVDVGVGKALDDLAPVVPRHIELELGTRFAGGQQGGVHEFTTKTAGCCVGTWLYDGKYCYRISQAVDQSLQYREVLSSGRRISGTLPPLCGSDWAYCDLSFDDGAHLGQLCMRFHEDNNAIISHLWSANKACWGKAQCAHRVTHYSNALFQQLPRSKEPPVQWFEVAQRKVLVKKLPDPQSTSWGWVTQNQRVEVANVIHVDGNAWVELTQGQLLRSCSDARGVAGAQGFLLVDGQSLGLGRLLEGPRFEISSSWTQELACQLADNGWLHVQNLGIDSGLSEMLQPELVHLEAEMKEPKSNGDFRHRMDSRIFFDTSDRRVRRDTPGLNALVDILQTFVDRLGAEFARLRYPLRLTGCCRPMLARYGRGGFYIPHVDNGDADGRVLTAVYYLNRAWRRDWGGELLLYPDVDRRALSHGLPADAKKVEISPLEDSMAIFRADWMVHEVAPADADKRFALTLWFLGEYETGVPPPLSILPVAGGE